MTSVSRIHPWLWGAACCALSGCSLTQTHHACGNCSQSVTASVPPIYENYTPVPQPQLKPIPAPQPPAEQLPDPPPAPATRNDTNKVIDYFESAREGRPQTLTR